MCTIHTSSIVVLVLMVFIFVALVVVVVILHVGLPCMGAKPFAYHFFEIDNNYEPR